MDLDVVFDVSTLYTLRPPEQNQKKHQTSVQLFHYTLVKSHKYTNSAEGNGNDIKTDTGYYMKIHHHRHHYILIQQKWQIKTRQWQMVSKNGPWIHPGKRCIKATCISAFLVFKQNKNCFSRQRDERQRCRAAGGRSGGFDGGFRSFTHSLCCIWKEGQLVMRKCKDLLKRYVYSILCVLLHLVSYLLFFCFYSFILKIALQDFIPAFEIIHLLTSVKLQPRLCVDTFNTIFFVFDGKTFLKETGLEWLYRRFVEAGNNMNRW